MKDSNKEKILNGALKLFNEQGTSEVSTNHICKALSISPGNLYYHFRSKDEIILALYKRMLSEWDNAPLPDSANMDNLLSTYERIFQFLWNYRFLNREVSSLYRRIAAFRKIFKVSQKKRVAEIREFIKTYAKAGIIRKLSKQEEDTLIRSTWFFLLYWLPFLETEGKKISQKNVKEVTLYLKAMLSPYFQTKQ